MSISSRLHRFHYLLLGLCVLSFSVGAQAATITNAGGGLTLTIITETGNPTSVTAFDIRGDLIADIIDGVSLGLIGLTDGPLIGAPAAPGPNPFLLAVDAVPATQGGVFQFDPGSIVFGGPGVVFSALFTPLSTLTNPALLALANADSILFGFTFDSVIGADESLTTTSWRFEAGGISGSSDVPEPASVLLLGTALVGFLGLKKRYQR